MAVAALIFSTYRSNASTWQHNSERRYGVLRTSALIRQTLVTGPANRNRNEQIDLLLDK